MSYFSITVHNIYMKTSTIVIYISNVKGENKMEKLTSSLLGAGRMENCMEII